MKKETDTSTTTSTTTGKQATQLQAKSDGDRLTLRFSIDNRTQQNIDFLHEFAVKTLNVNPSVSVLLRGALHAYVSHITNEVNRLNSLEPLDAVIELQDFIQLERDDLFTLAGHPEKTYDSRYEIQKGDH